MKNVPSEKIVADLRTAQNRMFPFVVSRMERHQNQGTVEQLLEQDDTVTELYKEVRQQLNCLLNIDNDKTADYHLGIVDSGKRAIEALVSYFCPPKSEANVAVNTENYVAFNKFSAVTALKKQKDIDFSTPFNLKMGQALTVGCPESMEKAQQLLQDERVKTLWVAWNSTSTGVVEKVEKLVAFRNSCNSNTLIVSDAASLPLFSKRWLELDPNHLPDVFFFSLRKQGLPYDGPQDEANQAINSGALYLFNQRALQRAQEINGPSLYNTPRPQEAAKYSITSGEGRSNHIKHLLKLQCCLKSFLENADKLEAQDQTRKKIQQDITRAFGGDGQLKTKGLKLVADVRAQSDTVYIISVPPSTNPKELIVKLKECGVQVSPSMHPELPGTSYFRFACYPATSPDEAQIALNSINACCEQA